MCVCVHLISSVFVFKTSHLSVWDLAATKAGLSAPSSSSSQLWVPSSPACSRLSFLKACTFGRQLIKAHTHWATVQSNSRYDEPIVYMNRPLRHVGKKPFLISYLFRTLHAVASLSLLKFCCFFYSSATCMAYLKKGKKKTSLRTSLPEEISEAGSGRRRSCCERPMWGSVFLEGHIVPNFAHTAPDVGDKSKCKKLNLFHTKYGQATLRKQEANSHRYY